MVRRALQQQRLSSLQSQNSRSLCQLYLRCVLAKFYRSGSSLVSRSPNFSTAEGSDKTCHSHSCTDSTFATAVAYLGSSQFQQPYELQMQYNGCGAETIAQLSTASWASLVSLDLRRSPLDAAGIAALAKGSWASLRYLDVTGKRLDTAAVTQLIQGGPWSNLRSLGLWSCNLGADPLL